jgi:hypothetical protein
MQYFYTLPTDQRQQILDRIEKLNALKEKDSLFLPKSPLNSSISPILILKTELR